MSSHYPRLLFTFLVLLAVSLAVLLAAPISADSHGEDRDSGSQGASDPEPSCPSCIEPPPAPTGFTVTPNGKTTFSVKWNSVSGATKYRLEYQNPGSQQWIRVSDYASGSTRTISGFDCDTAYTFRVRAFGDGDDYTATWGAASTRYATTHLCAPPEPTGFIAEASGKTSIRLNWDFQGGISRYSIDRRPSSTSSWTSVTSSASGSSRSYTVPNLTCNTAYLFRIRAYGDGYSYAAEWSPVNVSYNYVSTELCLAPAPRGFTVTANDDTSFNVRWTNVPGANSYLLEYLGPGGPRCPSCPDWVELGTYTSGYTRTIHGFTPGTRYDFRVRAYGDGVNLNSKLGDAATTSATIPLPVINSITGLSGYAAYQDGDTKIDLSWDPESGVSRFQIQYRLSTSSRWLTATSNLSGSSTSYTVTGLQCGKEYQFQIRAYGDGSSYASSWGPYSSSPHPSASTELCCATAPRNFTVTANDDDESHSSFNVSWSEVANADSYLLESMAPAGARCPSCPDWVSEGTFYSRGPHTISGFSPGTTYQFRVRAYGDGVNLNSKLGDAATTSATIPRPVINSITGLSGYAAYQDGDTKIDLSWNPESGVSRYQVQYRLSTSSRWLTATSNLSGSSTSYTVTGLQCSKEYQFQIRAHGDGSSYASSWGPYTSSPYPSASTDLCLPPAPSGFNVTPNDDTSFNVSWTNMSGVTSYLLEYLGPAGPRCPSCPDWVELGSYSSGGAHTISGFSPGTTYQFRVRAYGDAVTYRADYGDAATRSATTHLVAPPAPDGFTATAASDSQIDLSWDPQDGIARYQIQHRLSTSSWTTLTSTLPGTNSSYTTSNLSPDTDYEFRVRAYGDAVGYIAQWSPYSHDSATTHEVLDTPPAPDGFTATAVSDSQIDLSWHYRSGISNYQVQYRLSTSSSWSNSTTEATGSSTSYTVTGLQCSKEYQFQIRAHGDGSSYASSWGPYTSSPYPSASTDLCLPPAPSGFNVTPNDDTSFNVSWTNMSGVTSYLLEYLGPAGPRCPSCPDWVELGSYSSGGAHTISGFSPGTTYQFRVRAYGDAVTYRADYGDAATRSATTHLVAPPAPDGFTATAASDSQIDLSWDPQDGIARYQIQHRLSTSSWTTLTSTLPGTNSSYTTSNLSPDTDYEFRVRAYGDAVGYIAQWSPYSHDSATTHEVLDTPPAPDGFTATAVSDSQIDLSWHYRSGISNYQVQYRLSTSSSWSNSTTEATGSSTSYTVTGLQCSKEYQFQIRAHGDGSSYASSWGPYTSSPYPSASTDLCLPPAPSGFNVTPNDDTSFNVSWTNMSGVTSYLLEYLGPAGPRCPSCPDWVELGSYSSGGAHTISGFSPGTTYQFRVRAYGDAVTYRADYGDAATRSATTHLVAPPAPDGFTATAASDSQVDLSWDPQDGIARYQIQHRLSTSSWTTLTSTLDSINSSYTTSNLSPDTDYEFRVRAYGDAVGYTAQWSPYSYDSATTHEVLDTPPAPDGFTATAMSDSEVDLVWHYRSGIANHRIEQGLSSSSSWTTLTTTFNGTSYTVSNLSPLTAYEFRVAAHGEGAVYAAQWGPYSYDSATTHEERVLETPPAPTGLTATPDGNSVDLAWDHLSGISTYGIERRQTTASSWTLVTSTATGTSYRVSKLSHETRYKFRVQAYGDGVTYAEERGPFSAVASATTDADFTLPVQADCSNRYVVPNPESNYFLVRDCQFLLRLMHNLEETDGLNWSARRSIERWEGVTVGGLSRRITALSLSDAGLTGEIGSSIGNLTNLKTLDLSGNSLRGSLPKQVGDISNLRHLMLQDNQLTGSIPSKLKRLSRLQTLDLSNNSLSGEIPSKLGSLSNLTSLNLSNNSLTGDIPTSFNKLSNLTHLFLSGNSITGCISRDLGFVENNDVADLSLTACVVTVEVDTQDPVLGQQVTLTATTNAAADSVLTYQWQEYSNGQWIDLLSTSNSYSITSSTESAIFFKVVVSDAADVWAESSLVRLRWRPITVSFTASPEYPETADVSNRTVTLTAISDAPAGASYQWQQLSDDTWTNIGNSSTATTKLVSFTTRGTRKFRVVVNHTTAPSVESPPVHVTWDERAIAIDMLRELQTEIAADMIHSAAEENLLNCMNQGIAADDQYDSFDELLTDYAGTTKAKMDVGGTCHAQAEAMFSAIETRYPILLERVKGSDSEYSSLLDTLRGTDFEANVGDVAAIKLYARILSNEPTAASTSNPRDPSVVTGFDCIPFSGEADNLQEKINVLNCLVIETPHSFWVDPTNTDELIFRIDNTYTREDGEEVGPLDWLSYGGNDGCSSWFDGPVPGCIRHDLTWGSLKEFDGIGGDKDNTVDKTWNGRNKHLADIQLTKTIAKYGCQNPSDLALRLWCGIPNTVQALGMSFGFVSVPQGHNDVLTTTRDIRDIENNPEYTVCDLPTISNISANSDNNGITLNWSYEPGCTIVNSDFSFIVNLITLWGSENLPRILKGEAIRAGCNACSRRYDYSEFFPADTIYGVELHLKVSDREHGGPDLIEGEYTPIGPFTIPAYIP